MHTIDFRYMKRALPDGRTHLVLTGMELLRKRGARLTIVAFIEKASAVKAILEHLALPSTPLPLEKATGPHGYG